MGEARKPGPSEKQDPRSWDSRLMSVNSVPNPVTSKSTCPFSNGHAQKEDRDEDEVWDLFSSEDSSSEEGAGDGELSNRPSADKEKNRLAEEQLERVMEVLADFNKTKEDPREARAQAAQQREDMSRLLNLRTLSLDAHATTATTTET